MKYIFIIVSFFLHNYVLGQNFPKLNFRSITEADGLSNDNVNAITQDNRGVIWIATINGLNKYDGTRITKLFANSNDTTALQNNYISYLDKDNNGKILINYNTGFAVLQPLNNYFTNTALVIKSNFKDGNKNYIITEKGIFEVINGKANSDKDWDLLEKNRIEKKIKQYNNIATDKDGNWWACAVDRIDLLDKKTKKVISTTAAENLTKIFIDSNNECWITTWGKGTLKFDLTHKKIITNNNTPKQLITFDIKEWNFNGTRYIVEAGDMGIALLNTTTLQQKIYNNLNNENKLLGQCYNLFVDKDNNLWLSTNLGVKVVTRFSSSFEIIPIENTGKKINGDVYQCKELSTGYWLTKRYGGGIFQYDKNWKLLKYWGNLIPNLKFNNEKFDVNECYDFIEKGNNTFITTEFGMAVMDSKTNSISILQPKDTVISRLRNVVQLNDSTWMIRSVENGIYVFNPQKKVFTKQYSVIDANRNQKAKLRYLIRNKEGQIFLSAENDLLYFNTEQETFLSLLYSNEKNISFNGMAFDQNGILWVGSNIGLLAVNIKTKKIIKDFAEQPEMGDVERVVVDEDNKVWFNCENGYWCYNQNTKQMLKYTSGAGMPKQEAGNGGFFKFDNGDIYAGTFNALIKFDNDYLKKYVTNKNIIISNIIVNGKQNNTIQFVNDSLQNLGLSTSEKNMDIYFSVPDFAQKGNYDYYYKLSPGSSNWIKTETGFVGLNNLEYGKYELELKAQSNITGIYTQINILKFSVAAKWYQTLLFKILAMLSFLFWGYKLYKFRITQIRKNEKLKTEYENKMLHLEMQNLRSQMNPHFIFNSLNSINSFIVENKTHLASDYLTKFSRLIRLILDNSKNEIITLEKEIETLKLYLLMESVRFDKKFEYSVYIENDIEVQMIKIPPMIIQPYVENAIWHGLLQKPEKGKVIVSLKKIKNTLQITIEDDGIGRNKAALIKTKNSTTNKSYGLQITEQRIKQLNAANTIEIIDLLNEKQQANGTTVIISIDLDSVIK